MHAPVQEERFYVYTVNGMSDYTLWTLYRSYYKGINANIELHVYSVTCC
jgi:hypothetical protein